MHFHKSPFFAPIFNAVVVFSSLISMASASWPPLHGTDYEANIAAGGSGGLSFRSRDPEHPVNKIEVWGNSEGNAGQAIRIVWSTEPPTERTIGVPSGTPTEITLEEGERITSMNIWANDAVRKIEIRTDRDQSLEQGGDGGELFEMAVGSGFLAGLQGAADSNRIIRLGAYFFVRATFGRTHNPQVGLANGGNAFSAVKLDERVSRIDAWWGNSPAGNVLRRLKTTWEGGATSDVGRSHNAFQHASFTFDLASEEIITAISFRAGTRVDQMNFRTSTDRRFIVGGPLGNYYGVPDLGTGILIGFEGRHGDDIDKLAPVFAKEIA